VTGVSLVSRTVVIGPLEGRRFAMAYRCAEGVSSCWLVVGDGSDPEETRESIAGDLTRKGVPVLLVDKATMFDAVMEMVFAGAQDAEAPSEALQ
jgi:hypothetical protein